MSSYRDPGEEVVARAGRRLGIAPADLTLWNRGLTWHPGGLTQHLWAEAVQQGPDQGRWRAHVRTWSLRGLTGALDQQAALTAELPHAPLSALVRKPGSPSRVGLGASLTIPDSGEDWAARVIASVAHLQATASLRLAHDAGVLKSGMVPDLATDRPGMEVVRATPGPGPHDSDLVNLGGLDTLPFTDIAAGLRANGRLRAVGTHSGIAASIPWSDSTTWAAFLILEIRVVVRPPFGRGVFIQLSHPTGAPAQLVHALALNEAELRAESSNDMFGGWVARDGSLVHEAFVPGTLCTVELIRHLAETAVCRAEWLRQAWRDVVSGEWSSKTLGNLLVFRKP